MEVCLATGKLSRQHEALLLVKTSSKNTAARRFWTFAQDRLTSNGGNEVLALPVLDLPETTSYPRY